MAAGVASYTRAGRICAGGVFLMIRAVGVIIAFAGLCRFYWQSAPAGRHLTAADISRDADNCQDMSYEPTHDLV